MAPENEWGQVFHFVRFQKFDGLKPGAEGSASGSPWAGAGVRCPGRWLRRGLGDLGTGRLGERVAKERESEETAGQGGAWRLRDLGTWRLGAAQHGGLLDRLSEAKPEGRANRPQGDRLPKAARRGAQRINREARASQTGRWGGVNSSLYPGG